VIDQANGATVATRYVQSSRLDLNSAISDLRHREGTSTSRIGFVDLLAKTHRCATHILIVPVIQAWALQQGFDAVVWTDLPSNFEEETGEAFSVENATVYLLNLPKSAGELARRYVQNAPAEVDTPLRRNLQHDHWLDREA
jgi:hypothetical protein